MSDRYFTRDCKCCPFWDSGDCSHIASCSTFDDLFSAGTFYSAKIVRDFCLSDFRWGYNGDFRLADGYYVDCDGIYVDKVVGNAYDVSLYMAENEDIVGILMPEVVSSDK